MRRLMNLPTWRRKKGSLYWKAFAMWMYGWLLIQRGAREVRAEPSGQGVVGIARPVGASQACTRQPGSGSVTAVRHPSAVTARNEEVFYGGPSGSATRCNVQCERDGAVGSAGGNRGSDCALGSATQGVGATLASLLAALTAPNRPVSNGRRRIGFYSLIEVQLLYL